MSAAVTSIFKSQSGKADSKAPTYILILALIAGAYWVWKVGTVMYNDYVFVHELEENLKYDAFKIPHKPSAGERRELYLKIAKKYGIVFKDGDPKQYLRVREQGKWYRIDMQYRVPIKHIWGKTSMKVFRHTLLPK